MPVTAFGAWTAVGSFAGGTISATVRSIGTATTSALPAAATAATTAITTIAVLLEGAVAILLFARGAVGGGLVAFPVGAFTVRRG